MANFFMFVHGHPLSRDASVITALSDLLFLKNGNLFSLMSLVVDDVRRRDMNKFDK